MDTKKKMEKITKAGQPCRHCETPVVKVASKQQPRGRRAFYFEYHFRWS